MLQKRFAIAISLLLLPLSAFSAAGQPLRFGISRDVTRLDPFVSTRSVEHWVRTLVFEPLLLDKDFAPAPYIASSWKVSKDGKEITLNLREDVKFHDGKSLTAEDVKWSFEYALNPKTRAYGAANLKPIKAVTVNGPHRLTIALKEPYAPFLLSLASIQTLPVVTAGSLKPGGAPESYPPGTGPYRFVSWKRGQQMVVRRFPEYWQQGLPRTEEVVLKHVPDAEVRLTSLRAGDLDLADRIPLQFVPQIQRKELGSVGVVLAKDGGLFGLNFNTSKPPFSDKRLRQAVAYAIDKEEILRGGFWGLGRTMDQKIPAGSPWHFPLPERKRSVEKAKEILRQAGHPDGLTVRYTVIRGNEEASQMVEQQLRQVGIIAKIEKLDLATASAQARQGAHQLRTQGGDYHSDPDLTYYTYFHTEKRPRTNLTHYSNPRLDELLEKGRVTLDPQKRKAIYREVVEILHEDLPVLWIGIAPYAYAYGPRVRDFQMDDQGIYFSGEKGIPFLRLAE